MSGLLDGRVALVTGAGRGIGLAVAAGLARRGAAVAIVDSGVSIAGEEPDAMVARAAADGISGGALALPRDVGDAEQARDAVAQTVERFGGLDILVNGAAILRDGFVFKSDPADFARVVQTNLIGAFHMIAVATPVMREQAKGGRGGEPYGWGRIVNLVSTAGAYGNYGQAAYASAKAGLMGLTRAAALDMARSGVTANAVAPFAATRVTQSIRPANEAQAAYKARAMSVPAAPVATLVAWLCSPAAAEVSGQLFAVRGRQVMLFGQPRPAAQLVMPALDDDAGLAAAAEQAFRPRYVGLESDLEAFSADPLL